MNVDGGPSNENSGLVRPFLLRAPAHTPLPDTAEQSEALVRPYFVTGGRTQTEKSLAIETLVQLTDTGRAAMGKLRLERLAIAEVCLHSVSVAEVAARTLLHLGVARVLIADMEIEGIISTSVTPAGVADDIDLITRLIHGVRAL